MKFLPIPKRANPMDPHDYRTILPPEARCKDLSIRNGLKNLDFAALIGSMAQLIEIALYQPDIPQNTGAVLRTAACLGVPAHIIEPCGFVLSDSKLRRAGMDYLDHLTLLRHESWSAFKKAQASNRLVLFTTQADAFLPDFQFAAGDMLVFGRESAGVPDDVHAAVDARIRIPLAPGTRSLNLAASAAMVLSTALGQLNAWPETALN